MPVFPQSLLIRITCGSGSTTCDANSLILNFRIDAVCWLMVANRKFGVFEMVQGKAGYLQPLSPDYDLIFCIKMNHQSL